MLACRQPSDQHLGSHPEKSMANCAAPAKALQATVNSSESPQTVAALQLLPPKATIKTDFVLTVEIDLDAGRCSAVAWWMWLLMQLFPAVELGACSRPRGEWAQTASLRLVR